MASETSPPSVSFRQFSPGGGGHFEKSERQLFYIKKKIVCK